MPRTLSFPGYTLYPLKGRYLIYSDDCTCAFVNQQMTQSVPLFSGDAGRFIIEAVGFIAFPEGVDPTFFETGDNYERFFVSEQLTEADPIF